MATYAKDTTVTVDSTLQEIRRTLKRYNVTSIATSESDEHVIIAFEMLNRRVRFVLPLPNRDNVEYTYDRNSGPYSRRGTFYEEKYNQAIRQRWRALLLCIKAKLESVESGIETLEEAFMAQLVLADGQTMSEWVKPQTERMFGDGAKMPPLLGSGN